MLQLPILAAAGFVPSAQAASVADGITYFEKHIRPVLVEHCYECHAASSESLKGGLRLDYKGGWQKGGDSGPAIVPGHPEQSRLIEAIRYHNPDLEMPPSGVLPDEVVARFEEWIRDGAHDPREDAGTEVAAEPEIDLEEGRKFWSFQPIGGPAIPAVEQTGWVRDPMDHFILAALEEQGLAPSPDASPYALLRRLHHDLTGLPPTVAEIERFIADYADAPRAALEDKVDELLADPAFGERWGRHWLDLARYADSTGGGRAIPLPDAWRYRDYVIEAFAEDRPLDQLIREQIAGDLLPSNDPEVRLRNLAATGFLVLGPHNYENQDKELLELEIIDEQLDTIGRSFLGMTIGCARCHDHKFDPIPAADYYAMAGIFSSTTSVKHSNVSAWHKEELPLDDAQQQHKAELKEDIAALESQLKNAKGNLAKLKPNQSSSPKAVDPATLQGLVVDNTEAEIVGDWLASQSQASWVGREYIHDQSEKEEEKSVTYRPDLPESGLYEVRISYSAGGNRPRNVPVTIKHAGGEQTVHVDQQKAPAHNKLFESLGTFEFEAGNAGFVRISNKETTGAVIADAAQWIPANEESKEDPASPSPARKKQIAALEKDIKSLEDRIKKLRNQVPKPDTVMAVRDGDPGDMQVRIRGMAHNLGEEVPRGVLQVTRPSDAPRLEISSGSGRLELADWIASPDNPLTARVLANRIWLHLFGHGIVRTPDNFGVTGERPTHPELLDHLARRLIEEGWSTKKLVRALVLSRTYQLSSHPTEEARKGDPDNRLLSHAQRRPIDAEVLRDTILALAGKLERSAGGPSLPPGFRSEFGFKFTSLRRSVYVPVFRNTLYEVFATFDFANPNFTIGRRSKSTIPTQALFLFNSPFVHTHGSAAATELLQMDAASDAERVRFVYLRTLSRPPSDRELALSLDFLEDKGDGADGWSSLQRALFLSVDFRYLP